MAKHRRGQFFQLEKKRLQSVMFVLAIATAGLGFAMNAEAAMIGVGGSAGFSCDVNTKKCTCMGVPEGEDCKAVVKNCTNSGTTGTTTFFPCKLDHSSCECTMALTSRRPGLQHPNLPRSRNAP